MAVGWPVRVALAEFGRQRISGDAIQNQGIDGGEGPGVWFLVPALRVRGLGALNTRQKLVQLIQKQLMCI